MNKIARLALIGATASALGVGIYFVGSSNSSKSEDSLSSSLSSKSVKRQGSESVDGESSITMLTSSPLIYDSNSFVSYVASNWYSGKGYLPYYCAIPWENNSTPYVVDLTYDSTEEVINTSSDLFVWVSNGKKLSDWNGGALFDIDEATHLDEIADYVLFAFWMSSYTDSTHFSVNWAWMNPSPNVYSIRAVSQFNTTVLNTPTYFGGFGYDEVSSLHDYGSYTLGSCGPIPAGWMISASNVPYCYRAVRFAVSGNTAMPVPFYLSLSGVKVSPYSDGYSDGYDDGFNDVSGNFSVWDLFSNAFSSVATVLNYSIFPGLTIGLLLSVPLVSAVLFWIFKLLKGN
jgi:hypothetical protein